MKSWASMGCAANKPPSTGRITPDIQRDSSLAKKTAAIATLPGSSFGAKRDYLLSSFTMFRFQVLCEGRMEMSGSNTVSTDSLASMPRCGSTGKHVKGTF